MRRARRRATGLRDEVAPLLRMQRGLTRCLADAGTTHAAIAGVLRVVCQTLGWDCGRYFAADDGAGELHCTAGWSRSQPALRAFVKESLGLRIARGAGLGVEELCRRTAPRPARRAVLRLGVPDHAGRGAAGQ